MRIFRVIGAIVLVGLVLALGVGVYQAGVIAGAAGNGAAAVPYGWYGPGMWFGPGLGFGFGLFHLFGFLLFILLIVGLIRLVVWGGRGRRDWGSGHGPGRWGDGAWNGPHGPAGPTGPGGGWEQRMREYHDSLHASTGSAAAPSPGAQTEPSDPRAGG